MPFAPPKWLFAAVLTVGMAGGGVAAAVTSGAVGGGGTAADEPSTTTTVVTVPPDDSTTTTTPKADGSTTTLPVAPDPSGAATGTDRFWDESCGASPTNHGGDVSSAPGDGASRSTAAHSDCGKPMSSIHDDGEPTTDGTSEPPEPVLPPSSVTPLTGGGHGHGAGGAGPGTSGAHG